MLRSLLRQLEHVSFGGLLRMLWKDWSVLPQRRDLLQARGTLPPVLLLWPGM